MDSEQSNLIKIPTNPTKQVESGTSLLQQKQPQSDQKQKAEKVEDPNAPIDVIKELTQNNNPLPLLAVLDKVDLYSKTKDGVPLFNLLMNKFLPLQQLLGQTKIKFETDEDGKTPLHYAVEADDAKAVYWLLSKGAKNVADKFGNTAVMDAVRLGHKRCFLLCIHYQHINENLPHVAAQYNRVWLLKAMQALGLRIDIKNDKFKTPLEIAVENYSYEAAQFLAMATNNYQLNTLEDLTDSAAIMRKIRKSYKKSSVIQRSILPFLSKLFIFIFLISNVQFNPIYTGSKHQNFLNLFLYGFLFLMMYVVNWIFKIQKKSPQNPYFPADLDHICPSCFNAHNPQQQDHCDVCHCCVPKFQQHRYVCINKNNQMVWYITQYFALFMFYILMRDAMYFCNQVLVAKQTEGYFYDIFRSVLHAIDIQKNYYLAGYLIFLLLLLVQQFLFCLQLFGMAFMNKTYQQVTRSQDYPHLYTIFKDKAGKLKTREYRIFYKYKLLGGLIVGIRNIFYYFL